MPIGMYLILIGVFFSWGYLIIVLTQTIKTIYHDDKCSKFQSIIL